MPELPELPEVHHIHHHAHGDRFGRVIAIATVLATLSATCVAVLQARALSDHAHAAALAHTMAIDSLGTRVADEGAARVQLERFELAERQRARAGLARQQLLFAGPAERASLDAQAERWDAIAEETERESERIAHADHAEPLTRESELGPLHDKIFPLAYLAHSREHAYELEAERQVENRLVAHAEHQFASYAVSFTMLAIATFLFGYSLTPHGRPRRRLFAGTAVLFMAVAVTNAALVAFQEPAHPSHEAAVEYAHGQIELDSSHPDKAVKHFSRTIELDPEFADAYVGRAKAEFLANSPLALSGGSNITTPEALEKVIADERKARELGIQDPLFHAELGSDLLALGLRRDDRDHLEESVHLLEEAVSVSEHDPAAAYDLGAAHVALGDFEEAQHAFDIAVERTVYVSEEGERELRGDPLTAEEDLAVGLEVLQNVAEYSDPEIAERIPGIKERLVAGVEKGLIAFEEQPVGDHGAQDDGHGAEEGDHGAEEEGDHGAEEEAGHGEDEAVVEEEHTEEQEHAAEEEAAEEHGSAEPSEAHSPGTETLADPEHPGELVPEEHPGEEAEAEGRQREELEEHGEPADDTADEHGPDSADAGEAAEEEQKTEPKEPLERVRIELEPEATSFVIPHQKGFDPEHDRLGVQWYYQDPKKLGWTIITEVSNVSQPPLPPGANPDYRERGPYLSLTSPAGCLPSGTYRLELYVNGHLAHEQVKGYENPLAASDLRGLGAGLCHPEDWEPIEHPEVGLYDGFVSKDHDAGAYVFSLTPALVGTGAHPSRARMGAVLDQVLARFGDEILPAPPGVELPADVEVESLDGVLVRRHRLPGGEVLTGIGQSSNGQLLLNVVYGPTEMFESGEAGHIFGSLADRA